MAVTANKLERRTYSPRPQRQRGGPNSAPRARNLARDIRAAQRRRSSRESLRTNKAAPAERRARVLSCVQIVGSILLIFTMACGVVAGRAMVADLGYELVRLEGQLEQARGRTDTLSSQIATLQDPERIARAAEDIGMVPASSMIELGDQNAPTLATIASTTASKSLPAEQARGGDLRAVSSVDHLPSRIVLELEDTTEPTVQLATFRGLGDWILRWLKGSTPVEAHN